MRNQVSADKPATYRYPLARLVHAALLLVGGRPDAVPSLPVYGAILASDYLHCVGSWTPGAAFRTRV